MLSQRSEKFFLDKAYLSRLFSRKLNITFTELKQQLQITKAMELIDAGLGSEEVAAKVGFDDVHYFFRVFKKTVGTTPKQYKIRKK